MSCGCKNKASKIVRGAVGLAKFVGRVQFASDETIAKRRDICRQCHSAKLCPGTSDRYCTCSVCGCLLKAKTSLANESCPIGSW